MPTLLAQSQNLGNITTPDSAYNPGEGASGTAYLSSAELLISNVLTTLTIIGGIAFILQFLMGGINWITASGDKGKIDKAKGMMTGGAIGLIIILVSYSVVWIVGQAIGLDILNPAETLGGLTVN